MRTRTRLSIQPERNSRTPVSVTVSTILYGNLRLMKSSTLAVLKRLMSLKGTTLPSSNRTMCGSSLAPILRANSFSCSV